MFPCDVGFYCVPDIQHFYLIVTVFILCVGLATPWLDFEIAGRSVKPFVMASLVVFGLVPFIHWLAITPSVFVDKVIWVSSILQSIFGDYPLFIILF